MPDMFQHTAAQRRLQVRAFVFESDKWVSTHSRAEAAANGDPRWETYHWQFQNTAAQRRLHMEQLLETYRKVVSTHSRAEAAALQAQAHNYKIKNVSTHSRAEAAAPYLKKQEKSAD